MQCDPDEFFDPSGPACRPCSIPCGVSHSLCEHFGCTDRSTTCGPDDYFAESERKCRPCSSLCNLSENVCKRAGCRASHNRPIATTFSTSQQKPSIATPTTFSTSRQKPSIATPTTFSNSLWKPTTCTATPTTFSTSLRKPPIATPTTFSTSRQKPHGNKNELLSIVVLVPLVVLGIICYQKRHKIMAWFERSWARVREWYHQDQREEEGVLTPLELSRIRRQPDYRGDSD